MIPAPCRAAQVVQLLQDGTSIRVIWSLSVRSVIIHLLDFLSACLLVHSLHLYHFPMLSKSILPSLHFHAAWFKFQGEWQCSVILPFMLSFLQPHSSPSLPHSSHSQLHASLHLRLHHHQCLDSRGSCPKSYHCLDTVLPWWVISFIAK